jgi:Protein of unknown function (DUF1573)
LSHDFSLEEFHMHLSILTMSFITLVFSLSGLAQTEDKRLGLDARLEAAQNSPVLILSDRVVDLGTVSDEIDVVRKITLSNGGTTDLRITRIQTTCGCTAAGLTDPVLAPGDARELTIRFRPQGKLDEKRESVTLISNDPNSPITVIEIRVFVDPVVRSTPALVSFGDLNKGQVATKTVTVQGRGEDFKLDGVFWDGSDGVTARIVGERVIVVREAPRREYDVEVRFVGRQQVGSVRGTLMVRTNDDRRKVLRIAVLGRILQDLRATPSVIGTTAPQTENAVRIALILRDHAGRPFHVTGVEDSSRNKLPLTWRLDPSTEDDMGVQHITLTIDGPRQVGLLRGAFCIQTDRSNDATVTVPYTILTTNEGDASRQSSGGQP